VTAADPHAAVLEAVGLLADHWLGLRDRHKRHEGYRALIGGLLRGGVEPPTVTALVEALAERTGDEEAHKRTQLVEDTAARLRTGGNVSGWPTLSKLLGEEGKMVVNRVQELLGGDARCIAATYDYTDEAGCLRYQVVRFDPKDFRQRRPDGSGGWAWDIKGVERLLYRLPELLAADTSQTVFIPEGEKDVDALRELGLVATCNPGGAGKWQSRFAGPLRDRHIVILPDNDETGQGHARQVAESLAEVAASVKVLLMPDLPVAGDVSDWLDAGGTAEELARLAAAAPQWVPTVAAIAAPLLPADPPWPSPLAEEAFHGLAGEVVRVLEPASEADPAALLLQLLVGFGSLVGRTAHAAVEADLHFGNEFVVGIGRTSKGRKGTSWNQIRHLLAAVEECWAEERVMSGLSSGEGIIWNVRDPITKRERIKERGEDPRYVEVEADPGISDKRLLIVEPEFANVLRMIERQGNTLSAVLRQAWESGTLATLTKNSPTRARGAHTSLIGHCTAEELRRYLTTTEMANGFANRILWSCWRRSKELPDGGRPEEAAVADLVRRLAEALAFARGLGQVRRDDDARDLWRAVYGELSADRPGLTGALLGRAEAHVLRLSLLYALLDSSATVSADHLLAALGVWEHCDQSVRHVFGDSLGDPVADEVLRLLRASPQGMTRNDLRDSFGRHQSSERVGRALALLLQNHLARFERQETGGRPAERWFAVAAGLLR
jgi:hypothetical protein